MKKPTKCIKYIWMIMLCEKVMKEHRGWSNNSVVKKVQEQIKYRKSSIQKFVSLYRSVEKSDKKYAYLHTEEYNDKDFKCKKSDVIPIPYKKHATKREIEGLEGNFKYADEIEREKYVLDPNTWETYKYDDEYDTPYLAE